MTDEETLRKGDIVLLQAGDLVPADIQLLEARGLEVDEWGLRGELMPVAKRVSGEASIVYRGSRIVRGSGRGVVVATGVETEYGAILRQPWERHPRKRPRLVRQRYLILLPLLVPPFVAAFRRFDEPALAVPLFVTIAAVTLLLQNGPLVRHLLTSRTITRLGARGIDVRDEAGLDRLGHLDIICLDKTGVLTTLDVEVAGLHFMDEMPVFAQALTDGERDALIGIGCALCNDVFFQERRDQADPIDRALISFALKQGIDLDRLAAEYNRLYDKPFDSEDRHMVAGFERGDQRLAFAKGDPEIVLRMCSSYMTAAGVTRRIDAGFLGMLSRALNSAKQHGDIVLALACGRGHELPPRIDVFLCLILLRNPLRSEAPIWIGQLKTMGIRPVMLTGDRVETAVTIGAQAGIGADAGHYLSGKEMARMPLQEVGRQAAYLSIFARLWPSQKAILVRLLQQSGRTVAMVGDGANDTIALRVADVGVSFVRDSSPLARSVSGVLVGDLGDVLTIVTLARRTDLQVKILAVVRGMALVVTLVSAYVWMLS